MPSQLEALVNQIKHKLLERADKTASKLSKQVTGVVRLLNILTSNTSPSKQDCNEVLKEVKKVIRGVYILPEDDVDIGFLYLQLVKSTSLSDVLRKVINLQDEQDSNDDLFWNTQMKLHAIDCMINIFSEPETIDISKALVSDTITYLSVTFSKFTADHK